MRKIIAFSMKNKLAVWLLTLVVIIGGIYAGTNMKMETMPNFIIPVVSVSTVYQGASPDEVDNSVTEPIEQKLQALPGVQNVSATSSTGMSAVVVEYDYSKDMDKATDDIKEAVDQVSLPDQVSTPNVARISMDSMPVYSLSVSGKDMSLDRLSDRVEKDLLPSIQGVDGISSVTLSGQQTESVQISFKANQLKKYGLSQDTVVNLIKGNNVSAPLGLYTIDQSQKSIVVSGNIKSVNDLKDMRIPYTPQPALSGQAQPGTAAQQQAATGASTQQNAGQTQQDASAQADSASGAQQAAAIKLPTVKLSEVASVTLQKKAESISRTNGERSIGLSVVKGQDANTVDVVNDVKAKVAAFNKSYPDIQTESMFDQGQPIEQSVKTMVEKAIYGALFAMLIILLFLRNIRTTLISVISIPLSLLIALIVLKQMDITLNVMTLGAMTIAIGRVVDDSIVVIENIYRRMSLSTEKLRGRELIREATHEMFIPILSSTIVTIAVFLPMALVSGVVGQIFWPFALTIVFSLLASLLVAITIVPMLSNSFFKNGLKKKINHEEKPGKIASGYRKILNGALNHKILVFGAAVLVFAASLFLVPHIGASFMPSDSEKELIITYNPDPGQTVKDTQRAAEEAERYLESSKYMDKVQYSIGGYSSSAMFQSSDNQGLFFVSYKTSTPNFEDFQQKVLKGLNARADHGQFKFQDFGSGSSSNTLTLYVYGDSMNQLRPVTSDVLDVVKKDKNFTDADSSLSKAYDQYTITADQAKLGQNGIAAGQIAQTLLGSSGMTNNRALTTIKRNGDDLKVYLKTTGNANVKSLDVLTDQTVASPTGQNVKISDLAKVEKGSSPQTITKRDGKLYAEISAKVTAKNVSGATADLQEQIDKLDLPDGASVSFSGVTEQMNDSFSQLGFAMLAAVIIVYFVLVVTFGGGLAPFAILFSLPFAIIGSLVALLISGETISVSSMIGALMLIGIVITNAVVLIDRVIHKEKAGLSTREALLEAAGTRIRPILMTAIATICALLPLAFGMEGSGGLISKGLAVTVIGGITSSTLLTLLIVPIVYEALMKLKRKMTHKEETTVHD
ncbi:efflux RND transporter permease subunit [Sporolactobacillus inulinus]|uniref:Swarming motility protein SwrC n=1 Tax=Sporolactobacillus inulinus CASD TaxID=1069536 RepID=A0A0U1QT32_9BACL|nr:efflux RND transporter permease subunit [Sporolactobacillus inulinus]KLI03939.1 Swarming motility protein SwrC [Sporolactobacillus inulinus CASD]GEB76943.1 swarming motility protein SwrC [Sporolactobacillus inulinus]